MNTLFEPEKIIETDFSFHDLFESITLKSEKNEYPLNILLNEFDTPIGKMIYGVTNEGICLLDFNIAQRIESDLRILKIKLKANFQFGYNELSRILEVQVNEYFLGNRKIFNLPLITQGSIFQNKIWNLLRNIEFGHTISYKKEAILINDINSIRAVARANSQNRISIIIPCHRVIGENGSMTGYGGGIWRKKWLLDFEENNM